MLDIKSIRQDPDRVRAAIRDKHDNADLDRLLALDEALRRIIPKQEGLRAERKSLGRSYKGPPPAEARQKLEDLKQQDAALEAERDKLEKELAELLPYVPNVPHESVPPGQDARDNPVIHERGPEPNFSFAPRAHWDLGPALGMVDFERGARITGSAWVVLTGAGARLSRALVDLFLELHTETHGYKEVFTPVFANRATMVNTGQLPKFADQMYHVAEDDLFAIPTAEATLTSLHAGEMLSQGELPKKYTAYSECFRREAGAAGLETRGLIRVHQFSKVELFKLTDEESSYDELEGLTQNAETVLDRLGLRYRRVALCRGDLGLASAKTYDLEVWCPGYGDWLEISSCSNFEAYQARRANIRYRARDGKPRFCHTVNGSGLAVGRAMVAILETFQQKDGSVIIPECLRDYMKADVITAETQPLG